MEGGGGLVIKRERVQMRENIDLIQMENVAEGRDTFSSILAF